MESLGELLCLEWAQGAFWGCFLFLDLGAGYTGVCSLGKFTQLGTYKLFTFLYRTSKVYPPRKRLFCFSVFTPPHTPS